MNYEKHALRLTNTYPAIEDLRRKAKKRLPFVAWEYLESGTGDEKAVDRNREGLDKITFIPQFMKGEMSFNIETELFGRKYSAPFGVAPVGLTGLMWPKAEQMLARMAARNKIPFSLSTVATQIPEDVGPEVGDMGWFQLYPPESNELRDKLIKRAKENNFHTLIITADVPVPSRRERTKRAGMKMPPKITPYFIWQGITHPWWSLATLAAGLPRLRTVESYSPSKDLATVADFVRFKFRGNLTWDYIKEVRDMWDGPIILKGILHPEDAEEALKVGMDGIGVSNHGGRQFNGVPAAIDVLPEIVRTVNGRAKVIFDSGIRSGLDIIRALSLGADFTLLGRPFLYGVGALGEIGGDHVTAILKDDLTNNMGQMGIKDLQEITQSIEVPT
ncbi:MAG: alpha-hydroxy acid oxidase [Bacteroidota bacterium]